LQVASAHFLLRNAAYADQKVFFKRKQKYATIMKPRQANSREMPDLRTTLICQAHVLDRVKVRIFIDKSIVEIFANDRQWMLHRVYPTLPESVGLSIKAHGNEAKIKSLKAWQMKSIFETDRNEAGPRGG
jgi:sucrose-6-phosphate hydrolase SacC (GH32 family)